jgi:hypothetical protein
MPFAMPRSCVFFGLLSCLLAAAGGCGGNAKMAAVTGTVTFKGQPLASAQVNFAPVEGGAIASGQTDSAGRFRLGTQTRDDGAIVGKHRVGVIARGPPRPLRPGEVGSGMPGDMAPGDPLIPVRYFDPQTSKLEFQVVRGRNEIAITIEP